MWRNSANKKKYHSHIFIKFLCQLNAFDSSIPYLPGYPVFVLLAHAVKSLKSPISSKAFEIYYNFPFQLSILCHLEWCATFLCTNPNFLYICLSIKRLWVKVSNENLFTRETINRLPRILLSSYLGAWFRLWSKLESLYTTSYTLCYEH